MKYKKIGGGLLAALEDMAQEGPVALTAHSRMLGMAPVQGNLKPPRAIVFIHCDEKAELDVGQSGIRVNQKRGRVRTALLPLDRLDELSENARVKRILPSRRLKPCLNVAGPKVKLPEFKNSTGLTGKDVVVGIVDSGIDPKHPDFPGRILSIWDQTLAGPGVAEGQYGLELSGNLLVASRDTNGHGTHVAGIAAGAGGTFTGVAPQAELIIVKTTFQDAHIADGIRYVFRRASELGRPAVVNLSLGGHFDAHDGSDSLSQVIDDESGPGRIVVCAAGNEGNDNIHARMPLGAPTTRKLKFKIPSNAVGTALLNGWYPGAGKLEIAVTSPKGLATPFQKVITTGNYRRVHALSNARVVLETPGPDPDNGDHNFWVQIQNANRNSFVPGGTWELRVRNTGPLSGQLDVWMLDDQDSPQVVGAGSFVADSHKVGSPGCAPSAVTVAAYVTRNEWRDIDGQDREVGMTLDTIADFSSEGPLRNGQRKPDVTAPGAMIVSCLSADSAPERDWIVDSKHLVEAGTSMACPFIAGVIALLLQRNPQLDPAAVKSALKSASRIPSKPPGDFDIKWGFGLLQVDKL